MWNEPSKERLARIPKLYETEGTALCDKLIYLHFFLGVCDWYIAEYSSEEDLFFGYAILNDDSQNAEWGYVSFKELKNLRVRFFEVDCELEEFWDVRPASEVDKIRT